MIGSENNFLKVRGNIKVNGI